ncbi:hypothetical protein B0H16DRAFT_1722595 [Mycena metata]|uniref:F-box domain-containing protein n=1 Tax=Mycena metata TaxID=1033252 RepID=A0AAD7ND83_9AGAR|nr:hypothetical protein B0H16DRAFT_1722595 [Mycena metata]
MSSFLVKIRFMGDVCLASAEYGKEFYGTRDSTRGGGDLYTFKVLDEWLLVASAFSVCITDEVDLAEPQLSVYNYAAVCIYEGRPYDEHWAAVLSTIDVVSLFKLALWSQELFKVVMAHVKAQQPSYGHCLQNGGGSPDDRLSSLPAELFAIILPNLILRDRLALSLTSRKLRALCARELQACVKDVLAEFGLKHAEIRFMQTATHAVLCGQSIPNLIDYTFDLTHLDFVAPDITYKSVVRFMELATGVEPVEPIFNNLYAPDGTNESVKFVDIDGEQFVRVARSLTSNALDSVTYSPFSHLIGAVTHYGLWLAYSKTSTVGVTMPNRDCLDFADASTDDRIVKNFEMLRTHFKIDFKLQQFHQCGRTWECPMTPRTTVDGGCLSLFFPNLPMGQVIQPTNAYPAESTMSWSLGGRCGDKP